MGLDGSLSILPQSRDFVLFATPQNTSHLIITRAKTLLLPLWALRRSLISHGTYLFMAQVGQSNRVIPCSNGKISVCLHFNLSITTNNWVENFFDGWHSLGFTTPKDPSSGNKSGVFWAPSSLDPKDETRSYARTAHYDRVIAFRPNYHLLTESAVQKILIQEGKAIGAQLIDRNTSHVNTIYANKEVILAAGSTHSPQILQISGVGPEKLLATFDLERQVDLPGVGQNFQDHPTLYMAFECEAINLLAILRLSETSVGLKY